MTLFGALRLPQSVIFGRGLRAALGDTAAAHGKRALICTDARFGADPVSREICAGIERAGIALKVFDRTEADLPIDCIAQCVTQCAGFKPDLVIGIGGGSCMDMAKAVALMLTYGGDIRNYYGEGKLAGPTLPVIAVPTTAGTGSEVTPVAVVADVERGVKVGISSPYLIPRAAICDPELTLSCPPGLTAASGTDALTHAVEAFTAAPRAITPELTTKNVFVGKNVLSDQLALTAIANIWSGLERAYRNGADIEARERMMLAALCAGCAFGTAGTAAAHAIQYPVGNDTHTAHGVGVALLLPYVMEFNRPACVGPFAQIARTIGLTGTDEQLSHLVIDAIAELLRSVGIPRTLEDLGVRAERQDWIAQSAVGATRLTNNNPRKLDIEALNRITRAAFSGDRASLRA